jgi:ABC-type phosphate transport system permease subunit
MSKPLAWAGLSALLLLLVPVVYNGAMAYGAEFLVWDEQYSTYYYDERPGGFVVIVAGLLASVVLTLLAVGAAIRAGVLLVRRSRSRLNERRRPTAPA